MEDSEDLKKISAKLTLVVRFLVRKDEEFSKKTAAEQITEVQSSNFSSQEVADMLGISVKTVRNLRGKINSSKKSNEK